VIFSSLWSGPAGYNIYLSPLSGKVEKITLKKSGIIF